LEKHNLKNFNVGPFYWSFFIERYDEYFIGTKKILIEMALSQYNDNDDEKYDDG
jgi:hypothetical protein